MNIPVNSNENKIYGSEIITNIHKVLNPQLSHPASNGGIAKPQNSGPGMCITNIPKLHEKFVDNIS